MKVSIVLSISIHLDFSGLNLPHRVSHLRASYLRDVNFMLDSLSGLGRELKIYPGTDYLLSPNSDKCL